MLHGAFMFVTDYSLPPDQLGRLLEERGFESMWVPEHEALDALTVYRIWDDGLYPRQLDRPDSLDNVSDRHCD